MPHTRMARAIEDGGLIIWPTLGKPVLDGPLAPYPRP